MKTKYRWLNATIKFVADNQPDMPWATAGGRRDWKIRCAARARSTPRN